MPAGGLQFAGYQFQQYFSTAVGASQTDTIAAHHEQRQIVDGFLADRKTPRAQFGDQFAGLRRSIAYAEPVCSRRCLLALWLPVRTQFIARAPPLMPVRIQRSLP